MLSVERSIRKSILLIVLSSLSCPFVIVNGRHEDNAAGVNISGSLIFNKLKSICGDFSNEGRESAFIEQTAIAFQLKIQQ